MQMPSARIETTPTSPGIVHRYTPRYEQATLHCVEWAENLDPVNVSTASGPSANSSTIGSPQSIHEHVVSHGTSPSYPTELARVNMSGSRLPAAPTSSESPFSLDVTSPLGALPPPRERSIIQGGLIILPRKIQSQSWRSVPFLAEGAMKRPRQGEIRSYISDNSLYNRAPISTSDDEDEMSNSISVSMLTSDNLVSLAVRHNQHLLENDTRIRSSLSAQQSAHPPMVWSPHPYATDTDTFACKWSSCQKICTTAKGLYVSISLHFQVAELIVSRNTSVNNT